MKTFTFFVTFLFLIVVLQGYSQSNPINKAFKTYRFSKILPLTSNTSILNLPNPSDNWTPIFYAILNASRDSFSFSSLPSRKGYKNSEFRKYKMDMYHLFNHFIEKGAKLNVLDKSGKSPLYYAVQYNDTTLINALLNNKANIDSSEMLYRFAVVHGISKIVLYLQKDFPDPCVLGKFSYSALHLASMFGKTDIIDILTSNTPNLDCNTNSTAGYFSNLSATQIACMYSQDSVLTTLISKGAFSGILMKDKKSLLHLASMGTRIESESANSIPSSSNGKVIPGGNLKMVKTLLSTNLNLHGHDDVGANPLHWACYYRKIHIAEELLKAGEIPVSIKLNCEHAFASALSNYLALISKDTQKLEKSQLDSTKSLILIARKKYQDSLDKVIAKLVGRALLNVSFAVLAGVASAYQANLYGSTFGYGYSSIDYPVIQSDDLKGIKKYLKSQVKICDKWLQLIEESSPHLKIEETQERLAGILNVKELMEKEF